MSARQIIIYITSFLLFIGAQVLFVRTLVFFDLAFCFVYTTFILLLPISTPRLFYMFIAFFVGFFVDMFYDTLGLHAAACVLLAYSRQFIFRILTPSGGYDDNQEININNLGIQWIISYLLIMNLLHHLALFIIEASNFSLIFQSIGKAFLSAIYTTLLSLLMLRLFNPSARANA